MKKWLVLAGIFWMVLACSKPKIFIPRNDNAGLTGINNLSQVFIFFKVNKEGDTLSDMHKNQIISTTHFAVHIDRRLPIKKIIRDLEWLHKKRFKKSIHYVPGMHLFFSHVDTVQNKLRLLQFDSLEILTPFYYSVDYVNKYPKNYEGKNVIHLDLNFKGLKLDSLLFSFPLNKDSVAKEIYKYCLPGEANYIMLNADYNLSYDRFSDIYGFLVNLDSTRVKLAHKEFWYNPIELKK